MSANSNHFFYLFFITFFKIFHSKIKSTHTLKKKTESRIYFQIILKLRMATLYTCQMNCHTVLCLPQNICHISASMYKKRKITNKQTNISIKIRKKIIEIPINKMFALCRLCAQCPAPSELTTEIIELEPKLSVCCGWQPTNNEFQMPKKACNSCVNELQRSWNLVEQIRDAETQLNKLLSEQIQNNSNQSYNNQQTVQFKAEQDVNQTNYTFDTKFDVDEDYFDDGGGGGDDDFFNDNDSNIDDHGEVFGESINYIKEEKSKPEKSVQKAENEPAKKEKRKTNFKNDPFLATLNPEDFLDGGQLSSDAVTKLTKLHPDMNTMSWNDCQYNCTKCKQVLKGASNMYSHMRSIHIDDPKMSVKLSCFYCNFKHRREATINQHIAMEHFEHLKFR